MKTLPPLLILLLTTAFSLSQDPPKQPKLCSVEGQVVEDPGGKPIRKVEIQMAGADAASAGEPSIYSATTDAEGHFAMDGVKPGQYNLFLQRAGYVSSSKHSGRVRQARMSLTLEPGQEVKDIIYHMQPAAVITGKVVDEEGDPADGVLVVVAPANSSRRSRWYSGQRAQTNDLGEFRVGGLTPGKYVVSASPGHSGRAEVTNSSQSKKEEAVLTTTFYPGTTDRAQAVPIQVRAGDEVSANISLLSTRAFHVRGKVGTSLSQAEEGAVILQSKDPLIWGSEREAVVKRDGTFDLSGVTPGSYVANLLIAKQSGTDSFGATNIPVEVTQSDIDNLNLVPSSPSQVRGRFRMDDGSRIDWTRLYVVLDPGNDGQRNYGYAIFRGDTTNGAVKSDGSFEMKEVPAGQYHLLVNSNDAALHDYYVKAVNLSGKDVGDSGFTLAGGMLTLDVVASAKGSVIEGIVVDSKNHAVPDATVAAIPDASRRSRRDVYQNANTDQSGHFRLHGLNPGEYILMAFDDEDLADDMTDPDFLKTVEGKGETVKVEEEGKKQVVLKVIPSTEDQP